MDKPKTLLEQIEDRGINKSWLARKLEIKVSTLSNYLHGLRVMPEKVENEIKQIIRK